MKLILEIRPHMDDEQVLYRTLDKFPVTIGRAFDNDVILHDPYVSPSHLKLDCKGHDCHVTDLGSENGLKVNKTALRHSPVRAGDIIQIGHTQIGVFTSDYAVPAAVRLLKSHALLGWSENPLNVAACFMLALTMTLGWSFLEIWAEEPGLTLTAMGAATIAIIAVWAGIWAVTSRLIRKKSHFKNHVALICLYMIAGTCAWYAEIYVDFLTNENWLSSLTVYGCNFALLACLLYYSLNLATRLPRRQQKSAAVLVTAGLVGGIYLFSLVSAKTFNQQPLYPTTLEPYLAQLAPTDTVDKFMKDSKKLFSSDVFEKKKTPKKAG